MIFATNTAAAAKMREQYNQEFQQVLARFSGDESVWSNINWYIRYEFLKTVLKWCLCFAVPTLLVYKVPALNWNASAIGRIVLLNLFDSQKWEHLYVSDCLLTTFSGSRENNIQSIDYDDNSLSSSSCDQCESIDDIVSVTLAGAGSLFELYMHFNQPFIVEESHELRKAEDFFRQLRNTTYLANSLPCDLQSNILARRDAKLNEVLDVMLDATNLSANKDGWFVSFRNCVVSSLKASRLLLKRADYIPTYLKPFSNSWILVSHEYKAAHWKRVLLEDLVVVSQISGAQMVSLSARDTVCAQTCRQFEFVLTAGDALVFLASKWKFFYVPSDEQAAIMLIREYEWQ